MTIEGNPAPYIVTLPSGYDTSRPWPLVFGFHGRNRTHTDCQATDCVGFRTAMEDAAVLVYMKSLGGTGWDGEGERELNVAFFSAMLDELNTNYCIDPRRVFAAGTSSGANFTNILACRFGDRLRGVAPVAGHVLEQEGCRGQVAPLVIHGIDDYHVSFAGGIEARDTYLSWNGCEATSVPDVSGAHESVVTTPESHQCVLYQGCDPDYPVVWCEHSEGGYDGSTHGWPSFGGQTIWEFFREL
jgi:poly(3-hydroxybutyrate) depolymerase